VALVTGGGRNIGREIVLALARRGVGVVVNARSGEAEARAVVAEATKLGVRAWCALPTSPRPSPGRTLGRIERAPLHERPMSKLSAPGELDEA
jgi:NAD(P)-dependent dehydrogenase (short-subunit alcohol dehydrogenase family)